MSKTKPFDIPKRAVWEAYWRVKRNKGAAGLDDQTISDFERKLKDNLYKLWNRLSSGAYFPPPVKTVAIPKKTGGKRLLGIPTVADRIAQMVVARELAPMLERHFDADSYGYRTGKSPLEALAQTRKRCWRKEWVIDLDIQGFFDHIDHDLLMRALARHKPLRWVKFYVERWLSAPIQKQDGSLVQREEGTPQGGVISPLLANLFLHYAFDAWMRKFYPGVPFERYADDIIVHCDTQRQAEEMRSHIEQRLKACQLTVHPQKTKVVYCGMSKLHEDYPHRSFDFLGYTFRRRLALTRQGQGFVTFLPAMSSTAKSNVRRTIKRWRLHMKPTQTLEQLAALTNPEIRGWLNYYGRFYRSEVTQVLLQVDWYLRRWARHKFSKKTGLATQKRAKQYLRRARKHQPRLFAHWC